MPSGGGYIIRAGLSDKGYARHAVREQITAAGAFPNTPPRRNRLRKLLWSKPLYRNRNATPRMFGGHKDFHRTATRYNQREDVALAATVS